MCMHTYMHTFVTTRIIKYGSAYSRDQQGPAIDTLSIVHAHWERMEAISFI